MMRKALATVVVLGLAAFGIWQLAPAGTAGRGTADLDASREAAREASRKASLRRSLAVLTSEKEHDFEAFVSRELVNEALAGLRGTVLQWPDLPDFRVEVGEVEWQAVDGYPQVRLEALARHAASPLEIELDVLAFLEVALSGGGAGGEAGIEADGAGETGSLATLAVHVEEAVPVLGGAHWEGPLGSFAETLLQAELFRRLDGLATVSIPLHHGFRLDGPSVEEEMRIPTGPGALVGKVRWPGVGAGIQVEVEEVLFLRDGVHLFGSVRGGLGDRAPAGEAGSGGAEVEVGGLPLPAAPSPRGEGIEELEARVAALAEEHRVADGMDLAVGLRAGVLQELVAGVGELPEPERTARFESTDVEGYLHEESGTARVAGINVGRTSTYVRIEDTVRARFVLSTPSLSLSPENDWLLGARLSLSTNNFKVHGHYDPGPTGGIGADARASLSTDSEATARLAFEGRESALTYRLVLEKPAEVPLSARVDLGDVGRHTVRFRVPLGEQTISEGTLDLLDVEGELRLAEPWNTSKPYLYRTAEVRVETVEERLVVSVAGELEWL